MEEPDSCGGQVWGPGTPDHHGTAFAPSGDAAEGSGARFGLSGESVRQMEMKALKAMRGMAAA